MLALYLHLPFCLSKCRYCAFNSRPLPAGAAGAALIHGYLDAMRREMQLAARNQTSDVRRQTSKIEGIGFANANQNLADDRRPTTERESLRSVYFGGGTPTVLAPSDLCSLLTLSRRFFDWDESIEVTVEANPGCPISGAVDRAGLTQLRQAGVNRLSLGAQSFAEGELQLLGRSHGVADIREACRDARSAGLHNLSLDLIYGLPGQTADAWRQNLRQALELEPEHLSVYGLKLEPGTPLAAAVAAGELAECGEEEQLAMWRETQRQTAAAGLERYEISNYARPGFQSRHNLAYWHNLPCLALGAGASGYVYQISEAGDQRSEEAGGNGTAVAEGQRIWDAPPSRDSSGCMLRYTNHDDAALYIAELAKGKLPRAWEEHETPEQERADTVMMGLRLTAGLDRQAFEARFGRTFEFFYGMQLAEMEREGLMGRSGNAVFLTERGLLLSNYVLAHFI